MATETQTAVEVVAPAVEVAPAAAGEKTFIEKQTDKIKEELQKQADKIKDELHKAADKVKEIPQVKAALDKYEETMEMLRKAMDSDAAKKVFELLNKAKEAVYAAIEKAQQTPLGIKVQDKINEVQSNANAKVEEIKAKVRNLRPQ